MTYNDLLYICLAFFIIGFAIVTVMLIFYRIRASLKRRKKSFSRPAKFVPDLDLSIDEPPSSIDNSNARDDFSFTRSD